MNKIEQPQGSCRAFTLIELLIVIAIIMILIAILFPVFESARDKARQSNCASNLKQVGLAMVMYAGDYDEFYPRANYYIWNGVHGWVAPYMPSTSANVNLAYYINHYKWWYWLVPYTKTAGVFFCPSRPLDADDISSDSDIVSQVSNAASEWYINSDITNGYQLNLSLTGAMYTIESNGTPVPATTLGQIRDSFCGGDIGGVRETDETMIFCEGRGAVMPTLDSVWSTGAEVKSWPEAMTQYWDRVFYTGGAVSDNNLQVNAAPHAGGLNVAYCDGHAKWLSVKQFLALCPGQSTYLPSATLTAVGNADSDSGMTSYGQDAQATLTKDYPFWNLYAPGQ